MYVYFTGISDGCVVGERLSDARHSPLSVSSPSWLWVPKHTFHLVAQFHYDSLTPRPTFSAHNFFHMTAGVQSLYTKIVRSERGPGNEAIIMAGQKQFFSIKYMY